jgi:epoxyqueuosine reductase
MWPELETLLEWSYDDWTRAIRQTPLKRTKVRGLLRNLMVVAGNSSLRKLVPRLQRFLNHEDEHVREHAAWALAKLSKDRGDE